MILEGDAGVRVLRASGTLFYGRYGIAQGFQGRRLWRTRVLPCGDFSGLSEQGRAKLRGQPPGSQCHSTDRRRPRPQRQRQLWNVEEVLCKGLGPAKRFRS